ncbi:MAG: ammonium transporter [Verrucomicrobiales bacterium]|nr:ammonium transporter [Verrucomicrobiales bacterium]
MKNTPTPLFLLFGLAAFFLSGENVFAQSEGIDSGDTAWMLTSTVLVLLMTLPGLALFYGGLVRAKNLLSILMHCFAIACLASVLWVACLYSLAFKGSGAWIGDLSAAFLKGVTADSNEGSIPETVFIMFQMTFAIITPGLIVGAFVERMKFSAVMLFSGLWLIVVYAPAVHWVWSGSGWMFNNGTIDLAGGIVVHATAGASALVLAKMLGPRTGFPKKLSPPHSPGLVMMGAALLWVGWFGFNAGSQLAAGNSAGMTMLVTHISAAMASLTWMVVEKIKTGKPGLVGIVTGMVAGLASITPASGNVGPMGAMIIGLLAGIVCYFACDLIKGKLGIDDSLDVFAVHGVGGIMGTLLVAFLGTEMFGGQGINADSALSQFWLQLKGVGVTVAWSVIGTILIVFLCKKTVGLRISEEEEETGLDIAEHGEQSYSL